MLGFVGGQVASSFDVVGLYAGGDSAVGRAADCNAAILGNSGDADLVALVAPDDVIRGAVLGDVEADVTAAIADEDKHIPKTRCGRLGAVLGPVPCPERVFDHLGGAIHASVSDDGGEKSAPRDVVVAVTRDLHASEVQFIAPRENGFVAAFADDLLNADQREGFCNRFWQSSDFGKPRVFWWVCHGRKRAMVEKMSRETAVKNNPANSGMERAATTARCVEGFWRHV